MEGENEVVIFTKKKNLKGEKKKRKTGKNKFKKRARMDRIGMPVRFFSELRVGFCALKLISGS